MASYTQRYIGGDHEAVWAELGHLGPIPDALIEDCAAVARETMQRVAGHVARLAEQLTELGFDSTETLLTPPTATDHAELDLLASEIRTVPVALDACLRYVGGVWFVGDCPALDVEPDGLPSNEMQWCEPNGPDTGYFRYPDPNPVLHGYADPLVLPDVAYLRYAWDAYREQLSESPALTLEGFDFDFAPDEHHKANVSGSTHNIRLTQLVADPVIHGVHGRPNVTLVDYLRLSISWGGMPGWSFDPEFAPAALAELRRSPDF